jgi:hypothetical protein
VPEAVFEHLGAVEGDEAVPAHRGMEELEIERAIRPGWSWRGAARLRLNARPDAQEREENHETDPSNDTHGDSEAIITALADPV